MFPTFISILDIQSWWEVPSIAHFCSLFRTAFNLLDFDIEGGFQNKKQQKDSVWQVICFTEDDWFQLTQKFKNTKSKDEKLLHRTLNENFLPELPRLFKEKENLARKRLLESLPRRTSNRIRQLGEEAKKKISKSDNSDDVVLDSKSVDLEKSDELSLDQSTTDDIIHVVVKKTNNSVVQKKVVVTSEGEDKTDDTSLSETSVHSDEMAGTKNNRKSNGGRQRKTSTSSVSSKDTNFAAKSSSTRTTKKNDKKAISKSALKSNSTSTTTTITTKPTVGRQTNNSLSAATGQILIQPPLSEPHKKKLKTSQVFRQTDEDLQTGMHKILDMVKDHEDAWPFAEPVEEEYAPNYYTVIRKPMDLQTMEERLDSGYYKTFTKFRADFQLIIDNCRLYNGATNEYTEMVDTLSKVFDRATEKYLDQISSSDDEIAIEFSNTAEFRKNARNKPEETLTTSSTSRRKPTLVAQTDNKKRERSLSEQSSTSKSDPFEMTEDFEDFKSKKSEPVSVVGKKQVVKNNKIKKEKDKKVSKKEKSDAKKKSWKS